MSWVLHHHWRYTEDDDHFFFYICRWELCKTGGFETTYSFVDFGIFSTRFFCIFFLVWCRSLIDCCRLNIERPTSFMFRCNTSMYLTHNSHLTFGWIRHERKQTAGQKECQNSEFYVESGIISTASLNQKWQEKIRGSRKSMQKNSCFSMKNNIQILGFDGMHIHGVLEPLPKFLVQRKICN